MGGGRWDSGSRSAYASYTARTAGMSTHERFGQRRIHENLDPRKIKVRESRDSAHNPQSTPIIVALDVTGSMGMLANSIAEKGLGVLFTEILDRKPVTDPHLMFMGIGDVNYDQAPLQVSQFEADSRIIEQLAQLYIEHGGGGNDFESYNLAWYFARYHTVHDAMMVRRKRGYLFTVGDEEAPKDLKRADIERVCSKLDGQHDLTTKGLLAACQQVYNTFHIVIEEGNHARAYLHKVMSSWTDLLGQQVIPLADHTRLAETIVSALHVAEGIDAEVVSSSWSDHTKEIVGRAVKNLPRPPTTDRPVIAL